MSRPKLSPMLQTTMVQFIILGLGFVNSIILARLLGPASRGELAAALLWPQALVYLFSFGIQDACVYFAARPDVRTRVVLSNATLFFTVQMALLLPLAHILLPYVLAQQSNEVINASRFLLITTALGLFALYATSVLRARLEIGLYNLLNLIIPIGSLLGVLWLLITERLFLGSIANLYVVLYATLVLASLAALLVRRFWSSFQVDGKVLSQMAVYGAKVQLGSISQMANLRLDQMLMAALLPPFQLGLYVVAVSMASITLVVPSAIRTVIAPRIAQVNKPAWEMTGLEADLRMYWSLNVAVGLVVLLIAPLTIAVIFGAEFRPAIWATEVLIVASICLGGKHIFTGTAYGLGTPVLASQSEVVSLVVTVVALVLLLPLWGIMGAAIASLLAYATSLLFLSLRLQQMHRISLRSVLLLGPRDIPILVDFVRQTAHNARQPHRRSTDVHPAA